MSEGGKSMIFLTILETFLCCGTIFGWANLVKIFYEEGFYRKGLSLMLVHLKACMQIRQDNYTFREFIKSLEK